MEVELCPKMVSGAIVNEIEDLRFCRAAFGDLGGNFELQVKIEEDGIKPSDSIWMIMKLAAYSLSSKERERDRLNRCARDYGKTVQLGSWHAASAPILLIVESTTNA